MRRQQLQARAELLKLAHLLGQTPETFEYLIDVPPEDLRTLREQVTDVLFSAHSGVLTRLVSASRLLPTTLVAAIGERAFGPVLSARVAGLLDPERAVEMAGRLPVTFLADVAVEIDPRRSSAVLARIPPAQISAITRELVRRGEYVTMGRFVGHLAPESIAAAAAAMDDVSLLQVAFVLETKDGLRDLIDLLAPERLENIIDIAAVQDLWPEVLELLTHLRPEQRGRLADAAIAHDDAVLESLVASAMENQIWTLALPVAGVMSEPAQQRFARLPAVQSPEVLERIVTVARESDLWPDVLPLVAFLPDSTLTVLGRLVAALDLDQDELHALAEAGADHRLQAGLQRLAGAPGLLDRLGLRAA